MTYFLYLVTFSDEILRRFYGNLTNHVFPCPVILAQISDNNYSIDK
jgi:poly(A) polymerase Pap1